MDQFENIQFKKSRDFTEILNTVFVFVRQNYVLLGKSILYIAGPFILVSSFISANKELNLFEQIAESSLFPWEYYLIELALSFLMMALMASIVYEFISLYIERGAGNFDVDNVWQSVRHRFIPTFGAVISVLLLATIGLFACIVPGIYLYVVLSLVVAVLIFEKKGIGKAFSRSIELVQGHWWFTFGLVFVVMIIQYLLSFLFTIPQYVFTFLVSFHAAEGDVSGWAAHGYLAASMIAKLGWYTFYFIPLVTLAFHYYNLVERKEAPGLLEKVDDIGKEEDTL